MSLKIMITSRRIDRAGSEGQNIIYSYVKRAVHLNASSAQFTVPNAQFIWDMGYGMGYIWYMASAMRMRMSAGRETQIKRSILGKFHGLLAASKTNWSTAEG